MARHKSHFQRFVPAPTALPASEYAQVVPTPTSTTYAERVRLQHCTAGLARYQQLLSLHAQGLTLCTIADRLGISERTVNRLLAADTFPERKRRLTRQPGPLAEHTTYLKQRWAAGCTNGTQLSRELRGQGVTLPRP